MTTIASDGRTVAADGLRLSGDEPIEFNCRKLAARGGVVYGITGIFSLFDPLIHWHQGGADPDKVPVKDSDNTSLLVFRPDRVDVYRGPYPDTYPYPVAFGSGCEYAQAALACGKTPREAVAVAARFNVKTGGAIFDLDVPRAALVEAAE